MLGTWDPSQVRILNKLMEGFFFRELGVAKCQHGWTSCIFGRVFRQWPFRSLPKVAKICRIFRSFDFWKELKFDRFSSTFWQSLGLLKFVLNFAQIQSIMIRSSTKKGKRVLLIFFFHLRLCSIPLLCAKIRGSKMAFHLYHIVWSLAGMPVGQVLGDDPVEHHLHVVPDVRVPVLVDGQRRRGVQQLDMHQAHCELRQLRQLKRKKRYFTVFCLFYCLFTCRNISSVTRWMPLCCGLRCILRWSQAGWPMIIPLLEPAPPPAEPEPLLWLAEQAIDQETFPRSFDDFWMFFLSVFFFFFYLPRGFCYCDYPARK